MSDFVAALHSGRVLLMDGAMGTELQRAGIRPNECYELWNLTHPERVRAIHRAYVEAGAECLVTNTFQANPAALAKHGLQKRLEEINRAGVELARSAAGTGRFVLASVGPMDLRADEFRRVVASLSAADAVLLETWAGEAALAAARLAIEARGASVRPPVLLSVASDAGPGPADLAVRAAALGVAALGVNCGADMGVADVAGILGQFRAKTDLPLFARPNAGTPWRDGDRWVYPHSPAQMAAALPELLDAGACMVGGCCGTTPEHIAAFRSVLRPLQ
jgi:5-methyltetrahydrofolate--homocysteine methyltransferase